METDDTRVMSVQQQSDNAVVTVIRALFERLPSRQRQIFDLADLQGFTPTEIGDMLGMNPVTVRANLCKARRSIRSQLIERHPKMVEELGR
jgi:RNA polymerase sigma-70 factor (ECF subfamily)